MSSLTKSCVVCNGVAHGKQYGPYACFRCVVFFRRAVQEGKLGKCEKLCAFRSLTGMKFACRSCRFEKCLRLGMNPNAIKQRDKIGPRKPKPDAIDTSLVTTDKDLDLLLDLQKKQRNLHKRFCQTKIDASETLIMMRNSVYRRAGPEDINLALKVGFENAMEWANQFEGFWKFSLEEKRMVISEFGIAYTLLDQASKTAGKANSGFWLLQNDSFLHADFNDILSINEAGFGCEKVHAKYHSRFVSALLNRISEPYLSLEIDAFECVILKTLLLLKPSFPGKIRLEDISSEKMATKSMSQLMAHCVKKSSRNGVERFGEILLLTRSIRCAVKVFTIKRKFLRFSIFLNLSHSSKGIFWRDNNV